MSVQMIQRDISNYKLALAKRFVTAMNEEFWHDLLTQNFQKPIKLDGKACHVSTRSTAGSSDLDASPRVQCSREAAGSKRVNQITEVLLQFEERCLIVGVLSEEQLRALRSLNRGVLGKVIENFNLFKHQRSLPIAINILMFNSSKTKVPKDRFKDLIAELLPQSDCREFTIHAAKQSKTYSVIKQLIKSSS